ncbi:unnamed protein product, partial [Discosporangium mesarthrocarpum]
DRSPLKAIDELQAVGVQTVAARTSLPVRKTRLRNRFTPGDEAKQLSNNQLSEHGSEGLNRRSICESILVGGNVQTFVDFFYLTHRPGPVQDNIGPRQQPSEIQVPPGEMVFIKNNLAKAESARRQGDTSAVYKAYNSLAQYFQDMNDPKTGVYFYEKCLEISRLTSDRRGEMGANHHLGLVYDKMGDVAMATYHHERHQELAQAVDVEEERRAANSELIKVYSKFAEEREAAGDFEGSVEYWAKSLKAAKDAGDRAAEGNASYRLGKAYTELEEPLRAVNYLEDFEGITTELDDLGGQGQAFQALASAYESLGNDDQALAFLKQYLEVATKTQNLSAQEEACSNLAVLHGRCGQYGKAKEMFERKFLVSRKVVNSGQADATT